MRYLFIFLFSVMAVGAMAQDSDTLFAVRRGTKWAVKYEIKKGENLTMLARRFYVNERDIEFLVKSWGSTGAYARVKPFGDMSGRGGQSGALI